MLRQDPENCPDLQRASGQADQPVAVKATRWAWNFCLAALLGSSVNSFLVLSISSAGSAHATGVRFYGSTTSFLNLVLLVWATSA